MEGKMKKTMKFAAVAAVLVTLSGASAFAESRHRNETDGRGRGARNDGRNDSRRSMTMEGRVRRVDRDRDGYRVQLDRGDYWYHVPSSALRRGNELRVGVSLRFTGYLGSGNDFFVDSCDFGGYGNDSYYRDGRDNRYGYEDREYVRGVVERVDVYRGSLLLRDERSGRRVSVVMAGGNRNRRGVDLNDLRRGDLVTLSGDWHRGGVFEAYRVDSVRNGRY
jgi:hypothetical protein